VDAKATPTAKDGTTLDGLLNKRIWVEQPAHGYRIAVDTLLLAAAVPPGRRALELGCGVGGAMLALAWRVPAMAILGLDIQPAYVDLARRNIARNGYEDRLRVQVGDAKALPASLGSFDRVYLNPPFHDAGRHDGAPDAGKRRANLEEEGAFAAWLAAAARVIEPDGILTLIHRADREAELMALLAPLFPRLIVRPIQTRNEGPPKRIIIRASKTGAAAVQRCPAFRLHGPGGAYTTEGRDLLWEGKSLSFVETASALA
jgi:tRNA1(Val) A37 N6-methylase TrmN6